MRGSSSNQFAYRALRPQAPVTRVTIGDIIVNGKSIATPSGVIAASGAQWRSWQSHAQNRRVAPMLPDTSAPGPRLRCT